MQIIVGTDFEEMSLTAAEDFIYTLEKISKPVICLPSGKTPLTFLKIIRNHYISQKKQPDWFFVGLDEWVGVSSSEKGSCRQFFDEHLFRPLRVPEEKISFFNGMAEDLDAECRRAEQFIASHKGIDVAVLGIGTNGHLGLNEPGSSKETLTQVIELTDSTIAAAQDYFSEPKALTHGITLGLGTLLSSRSIFLLGGGDAKAEIIRDVVEGPVTSSIPGSFLQAHQNCFIYLDEAAARLLAP
jgi:galactosamine-6-phosphate isomerase